MTRVELPWSAPPFNLNDRMHWAAKAARTRDARLIVKLRVLEAGIKPMPAAVMTLHYQPRDVRRRDTDNLFATVKVVADGVRDAGVIADDDTAHLSHNEPVIHPPVKGQRGRLWIELEPRKP